MEAQLLPGLLGKEFSNAPAHGAEGLWGLKTPRLGFKFKVSEGNGLLLMPSQQPSPGEGFFPQLAV